MADSEAPRSSQTREGGRDVSKSAPVPDGAPGTHQVPPKANGAVGGPVPAKRKKTGGRRKGAPNAIGRDARQWLAANSNYLDVIARTCAGKAVRMAGPTGKQLWRYPDWSDRRWALELVARKLIPDVTASEISGPDGEPLTVATNEPTEMREVARRLALIFQQGDPANELAEAEARAGSAVAPGAATAPGSAFSNAFHAPSMPPDDPTSPPFNWHVRPDAGGLVVTHMGEQRAQCPSEAAAIKAAWAMARGQPVPAEVVPEDDGAPVELTPPAIDCRLVFHAVEGMAIACSAPPRANLPNQYRILDGRGQLVRTGNFSSLVKFLEERHGGPLPAGDMRTEESFRGPEPARFDQRELPPPAPTITRSHQVKRDFLP